MNRAHCTEVSQLLVVVSRNVEVEVVEEEDVLSLQGLVIALRRALVDHLVRHVDESVLEDVVGVLPLRVICQLLQRDVRLLVWKVVVYSPLLFAASSIINLYLSRSSF